MNPLQAIAKGSMTTASQVAGGTVQQIRSNLPSVSRAVYGLGMGVGPLIQNIISQLKEDKETKKRSEEKKDDNSSIKLTEKTVAKAFSTLSIQMKSVVSLLQDIKMINTSQLNAAQRASYEKQRAAFQAEENQLEGLQKPGAAATPIEKSTTGKKEGGGILSKLMGLFGNMPFWLQLLGGAIVGKGIWDMLDENTKKQLRSAAGELVDTMVKSVFKTVGEWLLNNKALAAGIAMLVAPTLTARAAMGVSRLLFPSAPKAVTPSTVQGPIPSATPASTLPPMTGMPQTSQAEGTKPSQRYGGGPGSLTIQGQQGQPPAAPDTQTQKPSLGEKMKGGVRGAGNLLGKGLGVLGVLGGGYNAFEEYKRDNKTSAALHGISAALSGLAMVPGPWSPFAAVGALGTGILGSVMGGPNTSAPPSQPPAQGPTPAATGNDNPFAGLRMGTAAQAAERTGGGPTALGIVDLAHKIQNSVSGIKEMTAFNDRYHQDKTTYASKHKEGLAMDFTIDDPKQSQLVASQVRKMLMDDMKLQPHQFQVRDEYKYPSSKSTAGHIHVQLNSVETANQLAQALGRTKEQLAQSSMVSPTGSTGSAPAQPISSASVATADATNAGSMADLVREAADLSRMILTGDVGGSGKGVNVTSVNTSGTGSSTPAAVPVMTAEAVNVAQLARHTATGT